MRRRYGTSALLEHMVTADPTSVRANQLSEAETDKELIKAWGWYYRKMGWNKMFAPFDRKGRITEPYVLYKQNNVTDPAVRAQKLHKARRGAVSIRWRRS